MRSRRRSWMLTCGAALLAAGTTQARNGAPQAGGGTTVVDAGPTAYGRALANLQPIRWSEMVAGKARFLRPWPDRVSPADADTCADCHFRDGRGPRPGPSHAALTHLARLGDPSGAADPVYGRQLLRLGHLGPAPGRFDIRWDERRGRFQSGEGYVLRRPVVEVAALTRGPLSTGTRLSLRVPPAVFGLGLLEAVPDADLLARADPGDADGDGISGTAHLLGDGTRHAVVARFGWKAAQPTLLAQTTAALHHDLGAAPASASEAAQSVVGYLRALAVPAHRQPDAPQVARGGLVFRRIGCDGCHVERLVTGDLAGWPELSRQTIAPFTDLLLHDMGAALDDGVREGNAEPREWRTPPLWGLGLLPVVSGEMRLLHDGRARSIEEAILWHGGEAAVARRRFLALPRADRDALSAFVASR